MPIFNPEIPRHTRLWWTTALFNYFREQQDVRFREAMETALPIFFPPEHKLIEPFSDEQDMTDTRFWDFFLFEYESRNFGNKTVMEYFEEHGNLAPEEHAYLKQINRENIYSSFRINEHFIDQGWRMEDLLTGKMYDVSEKLGTRQTKIGDVLFGRIIPKQEGGWMLSPAQFVMMPMDIVVPLVNNFRRIRGKEEKQEKLTALGLENIFFTEKEAADEDIFSEIKNNIDLDQAEKKLDALLKRYGSDYKAEELRKILREERTSNYTDNVTAVIDSFANPPTKDQLMEFMELWQDFSNNIPRKIFSGKTPAEKAREPRPEIGPLETTLREDFFNTATVFFNEHDYPSQKTVNHVTRRFQKVWLGTPQDALSGKTPMQAILEERKRLGNKKTDFGLDYFCSTIDIGGARPTPLKDISVDENEVVRDIDFLLGYISMQDHQSIRLDGRTGKLRKTDIVSITAGIKGLEKYSDLIKRCENNCDYTDFLIDLCFAVRLVKDDWLGFRIHKTNYKSYNRKTAGEKLFTLFSEWYFGGFYYWNFFVSQDLFNNLGNMALARHYMEKRETALCHFGSLLKNTEKYEDFFYRFYGSKKDTLKKDIKLKKFLKRMLFCCHVCPFAMFGLVELDGKDDDGLPVAVALMETGVKMMPHIIDEMFLRDLDQAVFQDSIGEFLKYHQPAALSPDIPILPKVGRNDPCPCGSGKKYKKCCLP